MDDDFPKEKPRFWIAFSILCVALAVTFVMAVVTSTRVEAQELLCVPGDALIRQTIEVRKQRPVWEATITPPGQPPVQVVITQSDKGVWTQFISQNGQTCLLFEGTDANPPIVIDKEA